jgi:DNA polymerase-3 subunit delta
MDKKKQNANYDNLISALKTGEVDRFYIFHGEERYLLERCLASLRTLVCPGGLDGFNYKRFEGKGLQVDEIEDAVNTFPAFAEKTLVEIHDYDIFKSDAKEQLRDIFSDLPDFVCVIFIYSTIEYKPDGRVKINKEILKNASVVEFVVQDQDNLVKWIRRHFRDAGKSISISDAEYLAHLTGGLMATLNGEIEKTAAYSNHDNVTRADIDAVVTPVLDTVAYKLSDALISRNNKQALQLLDELFQMREAPHKLMYSISLKMRQLLAARVCIENNLGRTKLMDICGIRHDFQARILMNTANKATLSTCRNAVLYCSETALELNSTTEPEARMIELVTKLSFS